jgi:hypothetical protein
VLAGIEDCPDGVAGVAGVPNAPFEEAAAAAVAATEAGVETIPEPCNIPLESAGVEDDMITSELGKGDAGGGCCGPGVVMPVGPGVVPVVVVAPALLLRVVVEEEAAGVLTRLKGAGDIIWTSTPVWLLVVIVVVVVLLLFPLVLEDETWRLLWIWFCILGERNMGFGVPVITDEEDAEGVETTVGEVGSKVKAPNPVVLAWLVRVSRWINNDAVSAIFMNNDDEIIFSGVSILRVPTWSRTPLTHGFLLCIWMFKRFLARKKRKEITKVMSD